MSEPAAKKGKTQQGAKREVVVVTVETAEGIIHVKFAADKLEKKYVDALRTAKVRFPTESRTFSAANRVVSDEAKPGTVLRGVEGAAEHTVVENDPTRVLAALVDLVDMMEDRPVQSWALVDPEDAESGNELVEATVYYDKSNRKTAKDVLGPDETCGLMPTFKRADDEVAADKVVVIEEGELVKFDEVPPSAVHFVCSICAAAIRGDEPVAIGIYESGEATDVMCAACADTSRDQINAFVYFSATKAKKLA